MIKFSFEKTNWVTFIAFLLITLGVWAAGKYTQVDRSYITLVIVYGYACTLLARHEERWKVDRK